MTDQEIENVYKAGLGESVTKALRAVYEAGRKHDERALAAAAEAKAKAAEDAKSEAAAKKVGVNEPGAVLERGFMKMTPEEEKEAATLEAKVKKEEEAAAKAAAKPVAKPHK